ncbi:MAG: helix-turn-helix transcriptional regulator [Terriglobales bacterium]
MVKKSGKKRERLNPKTAFGVVLRQLREKRGYSQEALAHRAGYHRNYISQLERGEKSPSLAALFNFANVFGKVPSAVLRSVEKLVSG